MIKKTPKITQLNKTLETIPIKFQIASIDRNAIVTLKLIGLDTNGIMYQINNLSFDISVPKQQWFNITYQILSKTSYDSTIKIELKFP